MTSEQPTMWRSRLFWRLYGSFGLLLLGSIASLGLLIVARVERHYQEQIEESLRTKSILVREAVVGRPPVRLQEQVRRLRREIETRITLLADDGRVLADSDDEPAQMENHAQRPEVQRAREQGSGAASRYSTTVGLPMMYVALRTDDPHGAVAYVRVALPLDRVEAEVAGLRRLVATAALATGLAALALAFWLARRIARPLQELAAGAERIAAGTYGSRVYAVGRDESGKLAQAFNHMSERLAEQFAQLEEERQQLRAILGGMVEGVVAIDADQEILFANERAGQLLEFELSTAIGRRLWEVVRRRPLHEFVRGALAEPGPHSQELSWSGGAASHLTVHVARLPGSPLRGAVLVLHDTTELRRLEQLRREFVANVSHELKTPLSVIKVCIETLLDGAIDDVENRGAFLERVAEQAERLHVLILDLLSLARIESGAEAFEFRGVLLGPVVAACLERQRARAEGNSQQLEAQAPAGGDLAIWGDEEAVGQIIDNLVDNALKYTPAGGRIRVRWHAEDGQVCLQVEDTGIGIPEPDLPRIFERFYRVDKARSRALGGTGLGLSIVKHLVQAMQGTVQVQSQPGQGTTFLIRLPRAEQ